MEQDSDKEKEKEHKPRLVIHKLVLLNFKSYKDRQVIGPFHKSFSAIVGPNGSGKSNTIDALLFVFGYRANKMRQGKLSELIHNSEANSAIESCTVEVHFKEIFDLPNGQHKLAPNSSFCVARTAYRNNSSKYTIDARFSSYGEVTTLLKSKGIDLDHKRFLILQGEVESIAQMKPKAPNEHEDGLLEYLEDIVGTSKYKEDIKKALELVDELNDHRTEKVNRVKLVEKEKAALESRKKEADSFLHDQNALTHLNSTLWQLYCRDLRQNIETAQENLQLAIQELNDEGDKQKGTKAQLEDLTNQYTEFASEFDELEKSTTEIIKELAVFDRTDVQLQEKLKHHNTRQKKAKKSLTDDNKSHKEATTAIENHSSEAASLKEQLDELETKLSKEEAELDKIRDGLKGKTEHFSQQIDEKQKDLQPWQEKVAKKKAGIDVIRGERDLLLDKSKRINDLLQESRQNLENTVEQSKSKKENLKQLKKDFESQTNQLNKLEKELGSQSKQESSLRSKASAARQKSEEAKASQAASRSKGDVLNSLLKLKAQGRLDGFYGRLGNLGRIDKKYDVAISTACPGLDNLVCASVETGQACLDHLRRGNLGRATILCLDALGGNNRNNNDINNKIDTPENAPRLFDLVEPQDSIYKPAFFQVLQNTLVAENLEQANRIAYGKRRWRVVTLDGKLIDTSGTMSGGGTRVSKGAMSSSFSASNDMVGPEMIAKFEKERSDAEVGLTQFLSNRRELEDQIQQLSKLLPTMETEMSKLDLDVRGSLQRVEEIQQRIKELESESKQEASETKRIASLEKNMSQQEGELAELQSHVDEIESLIKTLQNKILEVGGVKLRTQQSKVNDTKEMINHASDRLTKAQVGESKAKKDIAKLEKSITTNETLLAELEEQIAELTQSIKENAAAADLVRRNVDEAKEVMIDKREELNALKKLLDEKQAYVNKFREREIELQQQVEKSEVALNENKSGLTHWQRKLTSLKLNEIDDDDDEDDDEDDETQQHQQLQKQESGETGVKEGEGQEKNEKEDVEMKDGDDDEAGDQEKGETQAEASKEQTPQLSPGRKRKRKEKNNSLPTELKTYSDEELGEFTADSLKAEVAVMEERIANAKPNLSVLKEYRRRQDEYLQRAADLERVTTKRDEAKQEHDELSKRRLEEFMVGFGIISMKLKEMYQMITLGGNAELELVDSLDPFSEGIIFSVMPPKKSWKNIINLSGGEKTLSSLALVFALHAYKPTPLYFMDEIDAALDFRNVSIIANYIQSHTSHAQFIIISLRNNMFELASRLCGVFKTNNCTKSCTIENDDLAKVLIGNPTT